MDPNMVGAYGDWLRTLTEANDPGLLSFRRPEFTEVKKWHRKAYAKARECLNLPDSGGAPVVEVIEKNIVDGVEAEMLRWQLPYGPPTEAVLLKPQGMKGKLPGLVALHDHGGMKFFGRQKISEDGRPNHPLFQEYRRVYYGGVAWANEVATRGYVVLCHDAAPFGSRRVRIADVSPEIRWNEAKDPQGEPTQADEKEINAYNQWAAAHEHIWAKTLTSAGTSWPATFLSDDMRAVDVLTARPEVDAKRIGCCGLSGGGCRSLYLSGIDPRIRVGICVGMMTTWRDLSTRKAGNHTWMMWTPHLSTYLDYPEIMGLLLPKPMMVLNNNQDSLFTLSEMHRADQIMQEVYQKAGVPERYTGRFYEGNHKFDLAMQADAWAWFDRWLKGR